MKCKVSSPGILIPRQIFRKGVFQYVGNLVSSVSNPVSPPVKLYASLFGLSKEQSQSETFSVKKKNVKILIKTEICQMDLSN